MPGQLGSLPLSTYRRWWSFLAIRNDDDSINPSLGRENERIEQILESVFSED